MPRDSPAPAQHHKRLAIVTGAGLALALVVGVASVALPPGETLWHLIAAPAEDGGWQFVSIDGIDVREDGNSIGARWGKIDGFYDGCNGCGFDDDRPAGGPGRTLTCTLVACPERPHDALFHRFVHGAPAMRAHGERLLLTLPGHRGELVRTRPR